MTEKNAATLIIVALIGAVGAILAACIGLIPTILPLVRPTATSTSVVFAEATFTPSNTPLPDTASATVAPTETSTLTPTLQPNETPTETQTTVPTPVSSSANIDDYVGTWKNVDQDPSSDRVKLIVTRIVISKTGDNTANIAVCRVAQPGEMYVLPNPAPAAIYDFALVAHDFVTAKYPNLKWTILVQHSGNQLIATVQEYDPNNLLLNSDTFRLQKPNLLGSIVTSPCANPPATDTPTP